MIGVLGDPNSGKSVFSKVFGCILQKYSDKSVWVYDCDAVAPTADWYIYGLQRAKMQDEIEQKKIGAYFRSLDALIAARREEVEKLRQMKKALLERMFV